MTIAYAERVDSEEHTQLLQWGISLALVLMLHVGVAYFLFFHEVRVEQKAVPPAAYLDLPPLSAPAPRQPIPLPLQRAPLVPKVQPVPVPAPQPPAPPKAEVPPPPPPLPPKSASPVVVPPKAVPAPAPKVVPARPQAPPPAPKHTQPKVAPAPAPPATGTGTASLHGWQIAAAQRLEKFKMVSRAASWQGEQGVVGLQITIDHKGHILSAFVSQSSGFSTLDLQAMTMCRLAKHLPPLPDTIKQQTYTFPITIEFYSY